MTSSNDPDEYQAETGKRHASVTIRTLATYPHRIETLVLVENPDDPTKAEFVKALWDTGASGTITHKPIADRLGLKVIGSTNCQSSRDEKRVDLAEALIIPPVGTRLVTAGIDTLYGEELIIGMDIITQLDFHLTHDPDGTPVCIISEIE